MQDQRGTLTIYGRSCRVVHSSLVLIPPSAGCDSFSLYLHADARKTQGGFLMLDYLPVGNLRGLDDLRRACICVGRYQGTEVFCLSAGGGFPENNRPPGTPNRKLMRRRGS